MARRGSTSDLLWLREALHNEMHKRDLSLPERMVDAGFGRGDFADAKPGELLSGLTLLTQYAVGKPTENIILAPGTPASPEALAVQERLAEMLGKALKDAKPALELVEATAEPIDE